MRVYCDAAVVDGYVDGCVIATLKNKVYSGLELDWLEPKSPPFILKADNLMDEKGEYIESAPRPMMKIRIPFERKIKTGALLRMKAE